MGASLNLSVSEVPGSVNYAENTSQIAVSLSISTDGGTWNGSYDTSGSIVIDGAPYSLDGKYVGKNTTTDLFSGTFTITHNQDGKRSVSVSASFNVNTYYVGWIYAGESIDLMTIQRASVPTLSASSLTMGQTIKIFTNSASVDFVHTIRYVFAGAGGYSEDFDTPTAHSWWAFTPRADLAARIPNETYGTCTIYIRTYTDSSLSTQVGEEKSCSFVLYVPSYEVSAQSGWAKASYYNAGTAADGIAGYIKGYSRAQITFDASKIATKFGAAIASYKVVCGSVTVTAAPYLTGVLNSTSATATVYVFDTRGKSASATIPITINDYAKPTLSNVSLYRADSAGLPSESGTYIWAKATLTFYAAGGLISCPLKGYFKTSNGSYSSGITMQSNVGLMLTDAALISQTYMAKISATDSLGNSVTYEVTIPTARKSFHIKKGGKGAAFGKYAESDQLLDVAWDARVRGDLTVDGASISANNGLLKSTVNGNTVTIGSQNAGWCHFMNSADVPFYFNKDNVIDGNISPYSTTPRSCGTSANPWTNTYTKVLILNGSAVADYIIGMGWSGSWFYHIYKSQFCEAWCYIHLTNVAITNAWGYLYESALYRLPENLALNFSSMRRMTIECAGADASILSVEVSGWSDGNYPAYYLTRAGSATIANVYLVAHASGYTVVP